MIPTNSASCKVCKLARATPSQSITPMLITKSLPLAADSQLSISMSSRSSRYKNSATQTDKTSVSVSLGTS